MENVYHVTQIADDKGPVGSALSADYSIKTKALVTVLQNEARLAGSAVICGCANLTSPNSGEVTPTCELYCCAQLSFVSVHAAQPSSYSKGEWHLAHFIVSFVHALLSFVLWQRGFTLERDSKSRQVSSRNCPVSARKLILTGLKEVNALQHVRLS